MSIAALLLLPLLILKWSDLHLSSRDLPQLVLLSLIGFTINKLFQMSGLAWSSASDWVLLMTSEVIFTATLSWLLLHEPFRKSVAFALVLGFVGVYLIVEQSVVPAIPVGGGVWRVLGDLLIILGLLIEAGYNVRGKALLAKHSPLLITSASIVGSTIFWAPMVGWEFLSGSWYRLSLLDWIGVIWLALFCTILAYLAWFQALSKIDANKAASTLFMQPLLGTFLAIILLRDQLTLSTIIGGILIVSGVYFIIRRN